MTPECLMMLTGCPRDNSMYPRTDRCDDRSANLGSSSADMGMVAVIVDDVSLFFFVGVIRVFGHNGNKRHRVPNI